MTRATGAFDFHTVDAEEALWRGGEVFYGHRYCKVGSASQFVMDLEGAFSGPMTVGRLSYRTGVEMAVDRLGAYHVNVPLTGVLASRTSRGEVVAHSRRAVVYRPPDHPVLGFDGSEVLAVKFDASFLEHQAAALTGRTTDGVLALDDSIALDTGWGATWWAMVRTLREPAVLTTLSTQPLVAAPFIDALARCLLAPLAARAPHQSSAGLSTTRRVCALIEERPDEPWTVTLLAGRVGLGVRGLQLAFARHVGCTPMQFVARVRLERAHRELVDAEPGSTTVAAVASRWGFAHLGRFAAAYAERFGCAPSATLRSGHA